MKINANNADDFIVELNKLIEKYNVEIYVDLDGDTHSVQSYIVIEINRETIYKYKDNLDNL